jgi:hypothetical protein
MTKITPMLLVEAIEPCLPFWIDRMGFRKTVEVPDGDRLAFVTLQRDEVEIMYHTRAAVSRDVPALAGGDVPSSTILYIDVPNMAEILECLEGVQPVVPLRETWYGAAEIFVREPAGNVIAFTARAGY